ncbi:MAG: hypothetical protein Q8P80_04780 [Candidatus Levybacteria bacterium]|nr:hypothetical protein [Candidatus Levybacteria bacterium]
MHKTFYASGFLYCLPSQQILLQQNNALGSYWSLFGQKGQNTQNPLSIFQKAISQQLHIKLALGAIYPVYDYFKKEIGTNCYVFYAQINLKKEFHTRKDSTREWFTFKQISKLTFSDQIKQDIIVGERVIKAKARVEETITTNNIII